MLELARRHSVYMSSAEAPLPLGEIVHAVLVAVAKLPASPSAEENAKRISEAFATSSVKLTITTTGVRAAQKRLASLASAIGERGYAPWIVSLSASRLVLRRPGSDGALRPTATIEVETPVDAHPERSPWRQHEMPGRDPVSWYGDVSLTYA